MIKIGITGSMSSGKTTASRILSFNRGPLFSADKVVKNLYANKKIKKIIAYKLNFKLSPQFKKDLKEAIVSKKENLNKLEKIIHPLVRKQMLFFLKKNTNKRFLFCEIPLLVESKLTKYFDKVIFVKSSKSLRLKRYKLMGGNEKLFNFLDRKQIKVSKKAKFCDHVIVNNKSFTILKKNLLNIIKKYV